MRVVINDRELPGRMRVMGRQRVGERRGDLVMETALSGVEGTIERTPVDEGEARSSWVRGLTELGGGEPPGWEGSHPDDEAIRRGSDAGRAERRERSTETEVTCRSEVEHVIYLEYGTRRMEGRGAVRRSLAVAGELVRVREFLVAGML